MYTGELGTIARLGLPMIVFVVVDQALALIRLKQIRQSMAIHGTEFEATNYEALAAAFHLDYRLVESEQTASQIFGDALALDRPVLVEVRVDKVEYDRFK